MDMAFKFFSPSTLGMIGGVIVIIASFWSQLDNDKTSKKIIKLQGQIQMKTDENLKMLTGGDAFLFLSPSFIDTENAILFSVINDSKYPLYDVDIFIYEPNEFLSKPYHYDSIGNGKSIENIYKTTMPVGIDEKVINVITYSRNGETHQLYKCFRSSGHLGVKTKVFRKDKLIFEE